VWPQTGADEEVCQEANVSATAAVITELVEPPEEPAVITLVEQIEPSAEKKDIVAAPENTDVPAAELPIAPTHLAPSIAADPYRTDIYPSNVYSEELIYDADGNLIGKTTIYPTAFGSDTIWIYGHAYYELPGFGLIEWSGPSSVTEDYTMYENGNKVGIMCGEYEAPARVSVQPKTQDWPELTGEVIDQTINTVPEKNSTPPDYKPVTTLPAE
jgi:hypothetical protein